MKRDAISHHRRSIRLKGYNYSQSGAYFITLCTHDRECIFGEIKQGETRLNECGTIVAACWQEVARHFGNVELDEFVVMPNHVHGIIVIGDTTCAAGAKHLNCRNARPYRNTNNRAARNRIHWAQ